MKQILLSITIFFIISSCHEVNQPKDETKRLRDIDSALSKKIAEHVAAKPEFKDTIGVSTGPVKILSAKLIQEEYSNYRDIRITYKNISDKNIEGIKFHWMTTGVWGQEDVGRYSTLSTDELLKKGKSQTYTWNINSKNKKIYLVWPCEVVFSDGSNWKLTNN